MMGMGYYDMEGNPISDVLEWGRMFEDIDSRRIGETHLPGGAWVSTVFLGLDHSFGEGPPLIFETMVFQSNENFTDLDMERYATRAQAEEGHARMVTKWTGWTPGDEPPSDDAMIVMYAKDANPDKAPMLRQSDRRLLTCPDCGKKGVSLRLRSQEDHWGCRYCQWFAFTGGDSPTDLRELTRLAEVNPDNVVPEWKDES